VEGLWETDDSYLFVYSKAPSWAHPGAWQWAGAGHMEHKTVKALPSWGSRASGAGR
jgi:hypothetical protein